MQTHSPQRIKQQAAITVQPKVVRANALLQRVPSLEEGSLPQAKFKMDNGNPEARLEVPPIQRHANNTGLPENLKSGIENLSGYSMNDVKVHYNSDQPAQLNAHAYAQGTNIHLAPGQEQHLPHEAWHVVQQKQGRVRPTMQMKGKVNVNDDVSLEREADVMGARALQRKEDHTSTQLIHQTQFKQDALQPVQRVGGDEKEKKVIKAKGATGGLSKIALMATHMVNEFAKTKSMHPGFLMGFGLLQLIPAIAYFVLDLKDKSTDAGTKLLRSLATGGIIGAGISHAINGLMTVLGYAGVAGIFGILGNSFTAAFATVDFFARIHAIIKANKEPEGSKGKKRRIWGDLFALVADLFLAVAAGLAIAATAGTWGLGGIMISGGLSIISSILLTSGNLAKASAPVLPVYVIQSPDDSDDDNLGVSVHSDSDFFDSEDEKPKVSTSGSDREEVIIITSSEDEKKEIKPHEKTPLIKKTLVTEASGKIGEKKTVIN